MIDELALDIRALDRARISRDARFDGKFFIAVTTTGIYCRPICPSRTSNSRNVRYYATAAAAAEAGFRPCLRCRPEAAPGTPAWLGTSAVVRRALRLIEQGILDHQSVDDLAQKLGLGSRHLRRLFFKHVGASPVSFAQTRRLQFAKRLLDETTLPITEVALAAGFGSVRRFNTTFLQTYGRAPREFRKKGRKDEGPEDEVILKLAFRPPYDWKQVISFFSKQAIPGVEHVTEEGYCRTLRINGTAAIVSVRPLVEDDSLELRVKGAPSNTLLQIATMARRVFDTSADPSRTTFALRSDSLLGPCVKQRPGLRIAGEWDPFECAVRAIMHPHSLSLAWLVNRFGDQIISRTNDLQLLFPTPAVLANVDIVAGGPSKKRWTSVQKLARSVVEGKLDFSAAADCVVRQLVQVSDLDLSTAEYIALRGLGEPDAFPADDEELRQFGSETDRPLSCEELLARAESWRPWRGYAAFHVWSCAD
jgi:AraC family transcriptional regulator of adaptative response / DNA-3-methyladenine glycosylase II